MASVTANTGAVHNGEKPKAKATTEIGEGAAAKTADEKKSFQNDRLATFSNDSTGVILPQDEDPQTIADEHVERIKAELEDIVPRLPKT
ncbi:hypothetical protein M426DRAFT_12752 [Hypoxylon sp. CI-4A]|nr:hypothetical protein M426DRAFT_12752 [Hypoxylon sp. CI-4A]